MTNATLKLCAPFKNKIIVDGHDITHLVTEVSICHGAGDVPRMSLDLLVTEMDIDIHTDQVSFNSVVVPTAVARGIFEQLNRVFGEKSEAQP